jgi:CheY-like chemotaxis protein
MSGISKLILVVDDTLFIRVLLRRTLEDMGYEVLEADDGDKAEKIILERRDSLDLVVCDYFMPEQDGLVTLEEIRKQGIQIPFLMLTGSMDQTDYKDLENTEIAGSLIKPVDLSDFSSMVEEILG